MGLLLSPPLCIGITIVIFKQSGKIPVSKELFIRYVNISIKSRGSFLITFKVKLSIPEVALFSNAFIISRTSTVVVGVMKKLFGGEKLYILSLFYLYFVRWFFFLCL